MTALEEAAGNHARAARALGIARPTLYKLLRRFDLIKPAKAEFANVVKRPEMTNDSEGQMAKWPNGQNPQSVKQNERGGLTGEVDEAYLAAMQSGSSRVGRPHKIPKKPLPAAIPAKPLRTRIQLKPEDWAWASEEAIRLTTERGVRVTLNQILVGLIEQEMKRRSEDRKR
jgi:hypothetical protein